MHGELIETAKNEDNREFWNYIAQGEFRMQKCVACRQFRYPAATICPHCGSLEYSWELISGKGEVFTWTVLHKAYHPLVADRVPYNVAVIRLDEGVHFLSNIECEPEQIRIGLRVQAVLRDLDGGYKLPQFIPAED